MEHFAKIELIGIVGEAHETIVDNERVMRFRVVVNTIYRSIGIAMMHTSSFNCVYYGNCKIERGEEIHLEGMVQTQTYMGEDGSLKQSYEVKVTKIW